MVVGDGVPNQEITSEISKKEVEKALKKMRNNKVTQPDNILIEAWRGKYEYVVELL